MFPVKSTALVRRQPSRVSTYVYRGPLYQSNNQKSYCLKPDVVISYTMEQLQLGELLQGQNSSKKNKARKK